MKLAQSGGVRIAYEERGIGPPVLLVHGLGYDHHGWGPLPALLDVMFELPSRRDVSKCVITKETISKGLKPTLVTSAGAAPHEHDELAEESA